MELKRTLNLMDYRREDILRGMKEYSDILRHQFSVDRRRKSINQESFLDTDHGRKLWGPGSLMMLLYGRNAESTSTHHSWLSTIAVDLAQTHIQLGNPVAYEGCGSTTTLEQILSRFIFQLLERAPALLRRAEDFQEVASQLSQTDDDEKKLEALRVALLRIINLHGRPVWIILNRPDVAYDSCGQCLTKMLSLVEGATVELKILVVQRTEFWNIEKNRKEVDAGRLDSRQFALVRMDQS